MAGLTLGDYTMQERLKAIANKISAQYNETNICAKVKCFRGWVERSGRKLAKIGVSANMVSISGFVIGLLAINFLAMNMYFWALLCILANRLGDALDGAVAKVKGKTAFGVFLDACLDYIFYAGIILGFALANANNATAAAFLLFGFTASACAMLAYSTIAYGQKSGADEALSESPFYLGGLAQGAETIIVLVVLCLIPGWFVPAAGVLGCWCLAKSLLVISTAYYNFVIADKGKK